MLLFLHGVGLKGVVGVNYCSGSFSFTTMSIYQNYLKFYIAEIYFNNHLLANCVIYNFDHDSDLEIAQ